MLSSKVRKVEIKFVAQPAKGFGRYSDFKRSEEHIRDELDFYLEFLAENNIEPTEEKLKKLVDVWVDKFSDYIKSYSLKLIKEENASNK